MWSYNSQQSSITETKHSNNTKFIYESAVVQDVKVQQESCECCKVLLLSVEIKCTRDLNGWVLKVIEWCINLCKTLAHKGISSRQIIPLLRFLKSSVTKKRLSQRVESLSIQSN